jgi:hypothetical protein
MDITQYKKQKDLGYSLKHDIFFPLPYKKHVGSYIRTVNGVSCSFQLDLNDENLAVPYTKLDRLWYEIFVTHLVQTEQTVWQLGRVSEELEKVGQPNTGYYIASALKSIKRLSNLSIKLTATEETDLYKRFVSDAFRLVRRESVLWTTGNTKQEKQLYLKNAKTLADDDEPINYIEFSEDFLKIVKTHAVPHNRKIFRELQSPRLQDLYKWLVLKLHSLQDDIGFKWDLLLPQFSDKPISQMTDSARWKLKTEIKQGLELIKREHYREANIDLSYPDYLVLKKSRPHIEPDSKNVGYDVSLSVNNS